MPLIYDRKFFYDTVREDPFEGVLSQSQVDGMNYLLGVWEKFFAKDNPRDGTNWLSYALATAFHETAYTMLPIEEYGKGQGKEYGQPTGPYNQCYYGRGHVQLTWEDNYKKGQQFLKERYDVDAPIHEFPNNMLEEKTSSLVLYDGMIHGWFTGVGLPNFFNETEEDPYNARKIVNALDKAALIEGYYWDFKAALRPVDEEES